MGLHLGTRHPLARMAAGHCLDHRMPLVGGVACGQCWERAIRDDERFAVENELPRELATDRGLVDEVAVQRATTGHPARLTREERRAAIRRLGAAGISATEIARRLRTNQSGVRRELDRSLTEPAGAA